MSTLITIIIIYFVGVILSFGRILAICYETEEKYISTIPCAYKSRWHFLTSEFINILLIFSWITFLTLVIAYFTEKEKYFFKWSFVRLQPNYSNNEN